MFDSSLRVVDVSTHTPFHSYRESVGSECDAPTRDSIKTSWLDSAGRSRVKSSRNSSDREVASLKTQKQLGGKNKEEKKLSTLLIRNECACLVELKKKPQSS